MKFLFAFIVIAVSSASSIAVNVNMTSFGFPAATQADLWDATTSSWVPGTVNDLGFVWSVSYEGATTGSDIHIRINGDDEQVVHWAGVYEGGDLHEIGLDFSWEVGDVGWTAFNSSFAPIASDTSSPGGWVTAGDIPGYGGGVGGGEAWDGNLFTLVASVAQSFGASIGAVLIAASSLTLAFGLVMLMLSALRRSISLPSVAPADSASEPDGDTAMSTNPDGSPNANYGGRKG